ncbi:unnamed protein product [Closterium sp. NIES-53]
MRFIHVPSVVARKYRESQIPAVSAPPGGDYQTNLPRVTRFGGCFVGALGLIIGHFCSIMWGTAAGARGGSAAAQATVTGARGGSAAAQGTVAGAKGGSAAAQGTVAGARGGSAAAQGTVAGARGGSAADQGTVARLGAHDGQAGRQAGKQTPRARGARRAENRRAPRVKDRAVDFDVWIDDLQLFLQCDSKDGLSLFDLTSGASTAPAADADYTAHSQWTTRDAAARLAVRSHLPSTERAHFSQYKSAKTLYGAVVARYSSPATAALSRLMLPYMFPGLAAFATVTDLITHLRTSDTRYRAALPAEFCAKKPPPCTSPSTT